MEFPPNPPGMAQGLGYYQVPPSRPASIQVISIFAIVLGSLIVLCNGLGRGAPPAARVSAMAPLGIIGVVIITLISCILPSCILIFWRRPHVIAAFEAPEQSLA